jgi:hypothetical protein
MTSTKYLGILQIFFNKTSTEKHNKAKQREEENKAKKIKEAVVATQQGKVSSQSTCKGPI